MAWLAGCVRASDIAVLGSIPGTLHVEINLLRPVLRHQVKNEQPTLNSLISPSRWMKNHQVNNCVIGATSQDTL